MLRYHKKVYINPIDLDRLKTFTKGLQGLKWAYSKHCLDNVSHRAIDIEGLLLFIKGIELDYRNIFEFYCDDKSREIIKACYRINWQKNLDIILVISQEKNIVTIYLNSSTDNHETLRREQYING